MRKMTSKSGNANCSVSGCKSANKSLHRLPKDMGLRSQWLHFIFSNCIPPKVSHHLLVCSAHFSTECLMNEAEYIAGFAGRLLLKPGSVPTIRDPSASQSVASCLPIPSKKDVGCQTDSSKRSVGTQLSRGTLQNHIRSRASQASVPTVAVGVGTTGHLESASPPFSPTPLKPIRPAKRPRLDFDFEDLEDDVESTEPDDSTYNPGDSATILTQSTNPSQDSRSIYDVPKYIVFEDCLLQLFEVCPVCQRVCDLQTRRRGTFLAVDQLCPHCKYSRKWTSQPIIGSTPAGNLQLSAAVYFTGSSFIQLEKVMAAMRLKAFEYNTFRRHARMYLEPAIVHKWRREQDVTLQQLCQQEKVIIGGDMRADSPGHSAKYGCYSVMNLETHKIIDLQLVQSNEVGGSYHMEKEGLKRSLALLEDRGVKLDSIVTDRHPQIQKFLRDKDIQHFYDVWHLQKGVSKQVDKVAKEKDCEIIQRWHPSLKNHLYWTASSSKTGPERVAKWMSVINHVQDIHTHEDPLFPKCQHPDRISRDRSKWIKPGSKALYKLEKVLTNKRVLKDVQKLSPHHQTSSLEAFHSVILRFAPKSVVFPFLGMLCRLYLSTMHYNENADRLQATSSTGAPAIEITFPKAKKGGYSVKPVKTEPTFHYVDELLELLFESVFSDPAPYVEEVLKIPIPDDLCAQFQRPTKEEALAGFVSRFSREGV